MKAPAAIAIGLTAFLAAAAPTFAKGKEIDETARLQALSITIDALRSSDFTMRSAALEALQKTKLKEALPHVLRLLANSEPDVRGYAAQVLGSLGDPSATPYLLKASRAARYNWELADELRALGFTAKGDAEVYGELLKIMDDDYEAEIVRAAAFESATRLANGKEQLDDVVDSVATDRDRRAVGTALLDRGDNRGVQMMLDALASDDDDVSWAATNDLAKREPKLASKQLTAMMKDDEVPAVSREYAAALLAAYGSKHVAGVIPGVSDENWGVRAAAAAALAYAPLPKAKAALKKLLADKERMPHIMGGLALGVSGDKSAQASLKKLLSEGKLSESAVRWTIVSLALTGDKAQVERLTEIIKEERVPYGAMQLDKVSKLIVPVLASSLSADRLAGGARSGPDPDWALYTLVRSPDKKSVLKTLEAALKVETVRFNALMAIVTMGDPAAAALATDYLEDKNTRVKMAAAIAVLTADTPPRTRKIFEY